MAKKKIKVKRSKKIKAVKSAHGVIRRPCRKCRRTHTKNEDRFHGPRSFCKTHKTTKVGKKYCK